MQTCEIEKLPFASQCSFSYLISFSSIYVKLWCHLKYVVDLSRSPPQQISWCIRGKIFSAYFSCFSSSFPTKLKVQHTERPLILRIKAKLNGVAPQAASRWKRAKGHQTCFQQKAQLESIWSADKPPLLCSRLPVGACCCLNLPCWSSCHEVGPDKDLVMPS